MSYILLTNGQFYSNPHLAEEEEAKIYLEASSLEATVPVCNVSKIPCFGEKDNVINLKKRKHRGKRNLINNIKKLFKTTSHTTCTPFFIDRSRSTSRKSSQETRSSDDQIISISTEIYPNTSTYVFQTPKTTRSIFRNLFFPKATSTTLLTKSDSVSLNKENLKYTPSDNQDNLGQDMYNNNNIVHSSDEFSYTSTIPAHKTFKKSKMKNVSNQLSSNTTHPMSVPGTDDPSIFADSLNGELCNGKTMTFRDYTTVGSPNKLLLQQQPIKNEGTSNNFFKNIFKRKKTTTRNLNETTDREFISTTVNKNSFSENHQFEKQKNGIKMESNLETETVISQVGIAKIYDATTSKKFINKILHLNKKTTHDDDSLIRTTTEDYVTVLPSKFISTSTDELEENNNDQYVTSYEGYNRTNSSSYKTSLYKTGLSSTFSPYTRVRFRDLLNFWEPSKTTTSTSINKLKPASFKSLYTYPMTSSNVAQKARNKITGLNTERLTKRMFELYVVTNDEDLNTSDEPMVTTKECEIFDFLRDEVDNYTTHKSFIDFKNMFHLKRVGNSSEPGRISSDFCSNMIYEDTTTELSKCTQYYRSSKHLQIKSTKSEMSLTSVPCNISSTDMNSTYTKFYFKNLFNFKKRTPSMCYKPVEMESSSLSKNSFTNSTENKNMTCDNPSETENIITVLPSTKGGFLNFKNIFHHTLKPINEPTEDEEDFISTDSFLIPTTTTTSIASQIPPTPHLNKSNVEFTNLDVDQEVAHMTEQTRSTLHHENVLHFKNMFHLRKQISKSSQEGYLMTLESLLNQTTPFLDLSSLQDQHPTTALAKYRTKNKKNVKPITRNHFYKKYLSDFKKASTLTKPYEMVELSVTNKTMLSEDLSGEDYSKNNVTNNIIDTCDLDQGQSSTLHQLISSSSNKETKLNHPFKKILHFNKHKVNESTEKYTNGPSGTAPIQPELSSITNRHKPTSDNYLKELFKVHSATKQPFNKRLFGKKLEQISPTSIECKCKPDKVVETDEGNLFKWHLKTTPKYMIKQFTHTFSSDNTQITKDVTLNITQNNGTQYFNGSIPRKRFKNIFHFLNSSKSTKNKDKPEIDETNQNSNAQPFTYSASTQISETSSRFGRIFSSEIKNGSVSNNNNTFSKSNKNTSSSERRKHIHSPTKVYRHHRTRKVYHPFVKFPKPVAVITNENKSEIGSKNGNSFKQKMKHETNGTLIFHPEYVDFFNSIEKEKKSQFNESVTSNTTVTNDTSFHIMAYVMKPFDRLISVFRAFSPNNVTKLGDVDASDIKNGSLPMHLHPPNASFFILALNNTNNTSNEVHESKIGLLDVLGGWFHCILESYKEPKTQDVHFYLYTRSNPNVPEELVLSDEAEPLDNSTDAPEPELVLEAESSSEPMWKKRQIDDDYEFEALNPAKTDVESKWFNILTETKILIHGYVQDYQTDIMVKMKDAYLIKGAFNVIMVDWSVIGDNSCYPMVASKSLRGVGVLLARLLDCLIEGGVSLSRLHMVGFSLGAHVAGHAGTALKNGLVHRITGLDPALPYVPMEVDASLDAGDALFVDIIHSAAGYLGQPGPMGHVDFYPNGGSQQPGCDLASLGTCSHRRSALLYIESINSEVGFHAAQCDSWHDFQAGLCNNSSELLMGDPCPVNASGKYYIVTGQKEPFVQLPKEHVKVKKSLLLDLFYDFD